MKTILAVIGTLALLIFVSIVALLAYTFVSNGPILKEAKSFAEEAIPAITTSWNGNELLNRSAPELIEILKDGSLETFMADASRSVGELTSLTDVECTNYNFSTTTKNGKTATVECIAHAKHQLSDGEYSLSLIKRKGEWKILKFHVNPVEGEHEGTAI